MYCLKDCDGRDTSDQTEMRKIAVDFYSSLYASEKLDEQCRNELLYDLPVLTLKHTNFLETELTYEEVTAAVMGLSVGRAPGIDGLSAEFYKTFWPVLGHDYFEVLQKSIIEKILPKSFQPQF